MTDIVERLRDWAHSVDDGSYPLPPEGKYTHDVLLEAANTIDRLRISLEAVLAVSGKAERGQSFAEITKDMKHRDASYEPSAGRDSTTGSG